MKTGFVITFPRSHERQAVEEFKSIVTNKTKSTDEIPNFNQLLKQSVKQNYVEEIKIDRLTQVKIFKMLNEKEDVLSIFDSFNFGTKNIHRILPLKIITTVKDYEKVLEEYFTSISKQDVRSFKILYESRFCEDFREQIFSYALKHLRFEVNLKTPEYLLVIQVCKNIVGVSFVKNRSFNFRMDK